MYLDTSQIVQLSAAVIAAILILIAAYGAPLRLSVAILLAFIPFQPVETRLGSANIVMTYVLFGALILRGRLRYVPMLGAMLAVILAYLLSISQLPKALYVDHGLYLFFVVSGFLVFILAYNVAREDHNPRYVINWLIASNVVSVIYCLVQFSVGPGEKLVFFGIDELWMHRNRGAGDPRLVGPFGTPGLTAAYFMAMTVMLVYEIMSSGGKRKLALLVLAASNIAMIVGTANRGSFLVLLVSMLAFLYLFRAKLGLARIVRILVASTVILAGTAAIVVSFTDFGIMFDRLEETTRIEDGVPASRQRVWQEAVEVIPEKPWLGHGPLLEPRGAERRREFHPEQLVISYPHNLYLYLLLTVGIVGTACMLYFLANVAWRVYQGTRLKGKNTDYRDGWIAVGLIVIAGFFVDELKIEFLRRANMDYAHFIFALFGIFLGWADRAKLDMRAEDAPGRVSSSGLKVDAQVPAVTSRTHL